MKAAASPLESRHSDTTYNSDPKSIPYGIGGASGHENDDRLEHALAHNANDLRAIVADLYPEIRNPYGGRGKAVWRGGDGDNVSFKARSLFDFVEDKSYSTWSFLTDIAGYSKGEAARFLLGRAGLDDAQPHRHARRQDQAKTASDREAKHQRYLERKLRDAHHLQRTGATVGTSAYFERKGVAAVFDTHEVAPVLLDGQPVPGMVYSRDKHGPFVQLALRTADGVGTSYTRLYDHKTLKGGRDKDFIGPVGGAFILLQPKGAALPKDGQALARRLSEGYELGEVEGFATGASVAMAEPKAYVVCALSSGNLDPVLAALRGRYGYTRQLGNRQKAIDICIWGDHDESGNGQQKAHCAAFKHDCYVRIPQRVGDFNDLHQAEGLETVRRTRKVTPNVKLAFAKELAKQRLSAERNLPPFDLPRQGEALIVVGPQESGKTHQLAAALGRHPEKRVLVVVHRESLAQNLAKRLHFEVYNDYPAQMLRDIPRLVICFDSLHKLTLGGDLPAYDVTVEDECEQVFEHTTGRHIKHKAENLKVLERLLHDTPIVVCLDANAGALTANTLRRCQPARTIRWLVHEHHIAAGRKMRLVQERDDALDALDAETQPVWYSTDSLRHSRDLSAYLNDPRALTINSETSGEGAAVAYLLAPTKEASNHHRMIASPSVQTGLSDDSGHWQHVIGSFGGHTSAPQDAMQSLLRARGVKKLTVHVPRGRGTAITVRDSLEGASALDEYEATALNQEAHGSACGGYERLRAEVEAQRSWRRANYKAVFTLEAAKLGFDITCDLPTDKGAREMRKRQTRRGAIKDAGLERYVSDRAKAERLDADQAAKIEEKYSPTQDERYALEQQHLRLFYRLPDDVSDTELRDALRRDNYGALRRQILAYEGFVEPREAAEARARGEAEAGMPKGDTRGHLLRHDFHRHLGKVIGLNGTSEAAATAWQEGANERDAQLLALQATREAASNHHKHHLDRDITRLERETNAALNRTLPTRYDANTASVKAFVAWCGNHHRELSAAGIVTCTPEHLKAKPLEVIGDSLRRCGLTQIGDGKARSRTYGVTLESISVMWNLSRPRRTNWELLQQTPIKSSDNRLLQEMAETPSQTAKVSDVNDPASHPVVQAVPSRPQGYEALRAAVRASDTSHTRVTLLVSFGRADNGDPDALEALSTYLQKPAVRQMLGMVA